MSTAPAHQTRARSGAIVLTTLLACVHGLAVPTASCAQPGPEVSTAEFDQWMEDISNWGRWGDDDELGTLNLITDEKRRAATQLVRDGVSVSMALDLNTQQDSINTRPFEQTLTVTDLDGHQIAGDRYSVQYHGLAHSHMDGLPHFLHNGQLYNGFPASGLEESGAQRLGIHNAGRSGVVTRGVLVDMA